MDIYKVFRTWFTITVALCNADEIVYGVETPEAPSFMDISLDRHATMPENTSPSLFWIVEIKKEATELNIVHDIAEELNMTCLGPFPLLQNHFIFSHGKKDTPMHYGSISTAHAYHTAVHDASAIRRIREQTERGLDSHEAVKWHKHQPILLRRKRTFNHQAFMNFTDPFYRKQWHLTNTSPGGLDTNITGVWRHNITGSAVTVAVIDDGIEWYNKDLVDNYSKTSSWDLNDNDPDPLPDPSRDGYEIPRLGLGLRNTGDNHHGTRCAGEVAAVPNDVCGVGVAYGAHVAGIRLLDGPVTDSLEAEAFTKFFQQNHIYSCSWGPEDDGKTVDGPHMLAAAALRHGVRYGRGGYGSIYVVASGNGGLDGDNCNFDGYANSPYTITIGAVDEYGNMPLYSEECAAMLAVTVSSAADGISRDIVTTDWVSGVKSDGSGCTRHHTGTSAAAPLAAALIALMFDVNPCLTWRDVQYLFVLTGRMVDEYAAHWSQNGAGLWHSHQHGFGLLDAWRMVNAAAVWQQVPWLTSLTLTSEETSRTISRGPRNPLILTMTVSSSDLRGYNLVTLEYVQVTLTIRHPHRGLLGIRLVSPHGTSSVIASPRRKDNSTLGFDGWTFSTVRCWGETAVGIWSLAITDTGSSKDVDLGTVEKWHLRLSGTSMTPNEFKERQRQVKLAMDGSNLHDRRECPPPPVSTQPESRLPDRVLKVLCVIGISCFVWSLYETLEYLLCYKKEKRETTMFLRLLRRTRGMEYGGISTTEID